MVEEGHRLTDQIVISAIAHELGLEDVSKIKLHGFEVEEGSKKGDNFACVMKAITAKATIDGGDLKEFPFMSKCMPMNPARREWLESSKIFDKECFVYEKLMPRLLGLQKKHGMTESMLIPKCHFASLAEEVIVMENLKSRGFMLADKMKGVTMDQAKLILGQLAMLHSTAYHFIHSYEGGLQKFGQDFDILFDEGWMTNSNEVIQQQSEQFMAQMFGVASQIVARKCGDRPDFVKKVEAFTPRAFQVLIHSSKAALTDEFFCTIAHGDCWTNNFMFRYDSKGKLEDMRMLDLQLTRYSRLPLDLGYFFCSSIDEHMRTEKLPELLRHYHEKLTSNLVTFGYSEDLYPFEKLQSDYDDCFTFGFLTGTFISQIILNEKSYSEGGVMDMDNITSEEEMQKALGNYQKNFMDSIDMESACVVRIVSLMSEAYERGLLD